MESGGRLAGCEDGRERRSSIGGRVVGNMIIAEEARKRVCSGIKCVYVICARRT